MQPRKVEYKDGDRWVQVKLKLGMSRAGNYTFEHQGRRYVFKNLLEGTEVLVLEGSKWAKAGRIDRYGTIFLGLGETYSEMINRQNAGKTTEQIIGELRDFMKPMPECPSLIRDEKTLNTLKNAKWVDL